MIGTLMVAAALTVDFTRDAGRMRPELHSSGFGPTICSCPQETIDDVKSMGFAMARTHDWALINPNQRVCDYFHIFPLMHLDAKDPKNYVFGPTDYLLKRSREETGHDTFFRLGTSIEHSGEKVHFNSLIPEDFDKLAEVFAGTVRHYNHGWANGYEWGIRDWEIWNEPDGHNNMWCLPDGDSGVGATEEERGNDHKARYEKRMALFCKFFVTCLKRLKTEFPEIRVGGPALCSYKPPYFRELFKACKEAGVSPDFISWHNYAEDPRVVMNAIGDARKLCDEFGFTDCRLVINEWHYFSYSDYNWTTLRSPDPEIQRKIWSGPRSHNGIDSSCFNLAMLSLFQTSKLDQGFYYGCRSIGSWGFMDEKKQKYKVFYGMQMFGDFIRNYPRMAPVEGYKLNSTETVTCLAGKSEDGKKLGLLVSDYRTRAKEIRLAVKGVPADAKVKATVHDYTRNKVPTEVTYENGELVLKKADQESAAFVVEFE